MCILCSDSEFYFDDELDRVDLSSTDHEKVFAEDGQVHFSLFFLPN